MLICSSSFANTRDGLAGSWQFEEGTGTSTFDSSWKGGTGTLNNSPTWTKNCASNNCLTFSGAVDTNVGISSTSIDALQTLTYTAWVKPISSVGTWGYIAYKGNLNQVIFRIYEDANFTFGLDGIVTAATTTAESFSAGGDFTYGKWSHIAMTYDNGGTRKINLFINGASVSSTQTAAVGTMTADTSNKLTISYFFSGNIDDFRIYNRILTTQEIKDLYNAGEIRSN